jgi:hypothetical protein
VTVVYLLAQTRNWHSSEFQTTVYIYLLACTASKSQFQVLNQAGFSLSYPSAIRKIKDLSQERLQKILGITRMRSFMIIWDNLNIAFRVEEQRKCSKDHFDNGTTATLVPLHGVNCGDLALSLKPARNTRLPAINFDYEDQMPSLQIVQEIEAALIWHIEDLPYGAFPGLRKRLGPLIPPPPSVLTIPVRKTEQYPLPAMHIALTGLWKLSTILYVTRLR